MTRPPDPPWWRGTHPSRPSRADDPGTLRGEVSQADLPLLTERPPTLQPLWFMRAHVRGLTITLDDRHLMASWSQFEDCTFTQRRSGPVLNASGEAAQGSFGNAPCLYQGCRFVSVRFTALGGFGLGRARFEDCTFDRCRFNGHLHTSADLVGCTFIGPIDGCTWVGQYDGPDESRRNIIVGNDFTAATITKNVGWYDVPIDDQRWPDGFRPTPEQAPRTGPPEVI